MISPSNIDREARINLFSKVNKTAVAFHNANPSLLDMAPIDLNDDDVLSFLRSMQEEGIHYLLVGGFAMAFHGYIRATQDLDLWIKEDEYNIKKFKSVLKHHGVHGIDQTRTLIFIPGFTQLNIGDSGFVIDPMYHLKVFRSHDFDECFERAQEGEYKGVKFRVIHPKDLLKEKESTNRPKDQGDIEYLKNLE